MKSLCVDGVDEDVHKIMNLGSLILLRSCFIETMDAESIPRRYPGSGLFLTLTDVENGLRIDIGHFLLITGCQRTR
jgi:hypothetical protein